MLAVMEMFISLPNDGTAALLLDQGLGYVVLSFLILPVETFLGQLLPVLALERAGVTHPVALSIVSAAVFGALHLPGVAAGFTTGLSGGVVLSYAFPCWRGRSSQQAFWRTTGVHAAHNAAMLAFVWVVAPR